MDWGISIWVWIGLGVCANDMFKIGCNGIWCGVGSMEGWTEGDGISFKGGGILEGWISMLMFIGGDKEIFEFEFGEWFWLEVGGDKWCWGKVSRCWWLGEVGWGDFDALVDGSGIGVWVRVCVIGFRDKMKLLGSKGARMSWLFGYKVIKLVGSYFHSWMFKVLTNSSRHVCSD